ncbi:FMN reductase [Comamonas kerstersii]
MMRPLRVVAISGGVQQSSKSTVLAEHLLHLMAQKLPVEPRLTVLGTLVPQLAGTTWRAQVPGVVEQALEEVEQADVLVVVTPVFRGSYTGMFKHFFDLIHQDALIDKPILLAATGGSQRHTLMIDHQLRPLFSFFQARTLPLGVYATDSDFESHRLHSAALLERAQLSVDRALPVIELICRAPAVTP